MTPEQRQAKIDEDSASLEPDLTPKKKIDEELQAKADAIYKSMDESPAVAKDIKNELEAFWTNNAKARELLGKITPENAARVIAQYPEIADKIDDVMGMDTADIYKYLYTPLKVRLNELGIQDPFGDGKTLSEKANLDGMEEWILKATKAIIEKETEICEQNLNNQREVKEELETLVNIKTKAKPVIDKANETLAEAANADPKPENTIDEDGDEVATLPDGRRIIIRRDENGEIAQIWVHINEDDDPDLYYSKDGMSIDTDSSNGDYEYELDNSRYDFEKVLELAKRIFGEKPAPKTEK